MFETVELSEAQPGSGWHDNALQVEYALRNGRVDCILRRRMEADGKQWMLEMSAPLAGNTLPEERMTAREREICREDMNHDFLSGVYNRRYWETVCAAKLNQWATENRAAAVALVALDNSAALRDEYGQPVMDQLICFVANQWKKNFDTPDERIVCRLTDNVFIVGWAGVTGEQLAEEMRAIYSKMTHECVTSVGMMQRVHFTLTAACAGLNEPGMTGWQALYTACDQRLRAAQAAGGDRIV